jgi:hypothetical protein
MGVAPKDKAGIGSAVNDATRELGAAFTVAGQLGPAGQPLLEASQAAFFDGFQLGCLVAATVLIAGAAFAARFLPSRPTLTTTPEPQPEPAPALETASAASPQAYPVVVVGIGRPPPQR